MTHSAQALHTEHSEGHSGAAHALPISTYLRVYAALMVLMGLTVGASYISAFGAFSIWIALAIAVTKTLLVVLYFMGVKYGTRLTWLWASVGFIWLVLLFGTLGDYVTREWIRLPAGW